MAAELVVRIVKGLRLLEPEALWQLEGVGRRVMPKLHPALGAAHPSDAHPLDAFEWDGLLSLVPKAHLRNVRRQIDASFERMLVLKAPAASVAAIDRDLEGPAFIHLELCHPIAWPQNALTFVRKRSAEVMVPMLAFTDDQGRQKKLPPQLEAELESHGIREWARDRW